MKVLDINSLVKEGILPSNASFIKPESVASKCTPLSKVLEMDVAERKFSSVIIDNPKWVVYCKNFGLYSCDGEFIYMYDSSTKEFTKGFVDDRLIPIQTLNLLEHRTGFTVQNQEDVKMDNKTNNNLGSVTDAINDLLSGQPDMPTPTQVGSSDVFAGSDKATAEDLKTLKAKQDKVVREAIKNTITAGISDIHLADLSELRFFNDKYAEFIGWLTTSDSKNKVTVSSKRKKDEETDAVIFAPGVSAMAKQEFAKTGKGDKSLFVYDSNLSFVQNAPGPIKFGVVKFPVNGIVSLDDLLSPTVVDENTHGVSYEQKKIKMSGKSAEDFVIRILDKDSLVTFVNIYVGDYIKESAKTHTDPGVLTLSRVAREVVDKKTGLAQTRTSIRIKSSSSKTLLQESNYFPLTVNDTMKLSEILAGDSKLIADMNESFFHAVFRNEATSYGYNNLPAKQKAQVSKDDKGNIVSTFFDPKKSEKLPLLHWFTKEQIVDPQIPVKVKNVNEKSGKITYSFVKYDVLRPEASLEHLNPFNNEKFAKFLEACGSSFDQAFLVNSLPKTGGKSKNTENGSTVVMTADQSTMMALEVLRNDGVTGIDLGKNFTKSTMENLSKSVLGVII